MKLPTRPTPKLAVTKTIRLKLLLSSQNPVAISQAFMSIPEEKLENFPELEKILLSIMLPKKRTSPEKYTEIIPRLAFIYGCILQGRNAECSMMQRLVSACLTSNICNQKVRNIPARYLLMIIQIIILSNIMLMIFIDHKHDHIQT